MKYEPEEMWVLINFTTQTLMGIMKYWTARTYLEKEGITTMNTELDGQYFETMQGRYLLKKMKVGVINPIWL